MSNVAVITDSNSGITQSQAKELGIQVVPMPFFIDGQTYYEDISMTQPEFYEYLKNVPDFYLSYPELFVDFKSIKGLDQNTAEKLEKLYYSSKFTLLLTSLKSLNFTKITTYNYYIIDFKFFIATLYY